LVEVGDRGVKELAEAYIWTAAPFSCLLEKIDGVMAGLTF